MDQGGWIDNHLNEVRQRLESLNNQINGMEVRNLRMNDSIRDLGVEIQPSHLEQKFENLMEKYLEQKLENLMEKHLEQKLKKILWRNKKRN